MLSFSFSLFVFSISFSQRHTHTASPPGRLAAALPPRTHPLPPSQLPTLALSFETCPALFEVQGMRCAPLTLQTLQTPEPPTPYLVKLAKTRRLSDMQWRSGANMSTPLSAAVQQTCAADMCIGPLDHLASCNLPPISTTSPHSHLLPPRSSCALEMVSAPRQPHFLL
jgi:hypothetical protein